MPVQVEYTTGGRGNTVPYPPLNDEIQYNHGYVDLRANPEAAANIPEATRSAALSELLIKLAQPKSALISLGCDLGEHADPKSRFDTRQRAGGYVQIGDARLRDVAGNFLKQAAEHLEAALKPGVGADRWVVRFELRAVAYEFDARVEAHSVWVWFDAKASTPEKAKASRERLLRCLAGAVAAFPPSEV